MVVEQKRRREGTDTEPASVKALRQENEELREERAKPREGNEGNEEMKLAKFGAESQTPQEKDKEFKLPTEVWAIIAGELDQDDVNQDVLHGCGTPLRRLGNDSPGID